MRHRDAVHLPTARQIEPNVSQIASGKHRDTVHLQTARPSEPNVSQVVSRGTEMRFTYPLQGNASQTSAKWSQRGTEMRFTYPLQRKASRTSSRWSHEAPRCGSLTVCKAKRADRQPGGLTRDRDVVRLHPARQREPTSARWSQRGTEMRFTYILQGKASRTSARRFHEAPRCGSLTHCKAKRADRKPGGLMRHRDAVHLQSTRQREPNISQVVLRGTEMRFTYKLQGTPSQTSARWSHEAPRCGSITRCKAKRAERQPGGLTRHQFYRLNEGCRHRAGIHLLPIMQSELNISYCDSKNRCGSLTNCIATRTERQLSCQQ